MEVAAPQIITASPQNQALINLTSQAQQINSPHNSTPHNRSSHNRGLFAPRPQQINSTPINRNPQIPLFAPRTPQNFPQRPQTSQSLVCLPNNGALSNNIDPIVAQELARRRSTVPNRQQLPLDLVQRTTMSQDRSRVNLKHLETLNREFQALPEEEVWGHDCIMQFKSKVGNILQPNAPSNG